METTSMEEVEAWVCPEDAARMVDGCLWYPRSHQGYENGAYVGGIGISKTPREGWVAVIAIQIGETWVNAGERSAAGIRARGEPTPAARAMLAKASLFD